MSLVSTFSALKLSFISELEEEILRICFGLGIIRVSRVMMTLEDARELRIEHGAFTQNTSIPGTNAIFVVGLRP